MDSAPTLRYDLSGNFAGSREWSMVRLSVCIEMYWPELPFAERVAASGSRPVCLHTNFGITATRTCLPSRRRHVPAGVTLAGFVCEPGFALTGPTPLDVHVAGVARAAAVGRQPGDLYIYRHGG